MGGPARVSLRLPSLRGATAPQPKESVHTMQPGYSILGSLVLDYLNYLVAYVLILMMRVRAAGSNVLTNRGRPFLRVKPPPLHSRLAHPPPSCPHPSYSS